MNVVKPSVIGVDIPIQKLQTALYTKLLALWPVTANTFNMYGRAYRNQTNDGYSPEVYAGNNEYKDVYFDDSLAASAFFGLGDNQKTDKASTTADVFVIFMVDLSKIKPAATRNDEEARVDVERICLQRDYGFFLSNIITGIDQVFKEFSGWKNVQGIKFRDEHPWHCFRLNFKVTYNIYDC